MRLSLGPGLYLGRVLGLDLGTGLCLGRGFGPGLYLGRGLGLGPGLGIGLCLDLVPSLEANHEKPKNKTAQVFVWMCA